MDIKIKKAALADIELLMQWRMTVLHEVFATPDSDPMLELAQANRLYYQAALPTEGHIACFAYAGNTIIGCGGVCLYQEMPSPDNPTGGCAYLMNIYTCPEFRRQGIGRQVVAWLIQQAGQRGFTKIYLETSACGQPLYREMGFVDMQGYMQFKIKE